MNTYHINSDETYRQWPGSDSHTVAGDAPKIETIAGAEYLLEQLIDKHTLAVIAEMIGEICDGKAQHIQENWQDNETCKPWERAAWQFHKLYNKLEV